MTTSARPRVPATSDQLVAFLRDTDRVAAMLGGSPEAFAAFQQDYANSFGRSDPHFHTKVAEERQRVTAQMARENGGGHTPVDLTPDGTGRSARNALYSSTAAGVAVDGVFNTLGEFAAAISPKANVHDAALMAKVAQVRNAYSEGVPAEGGFLVPEDFRSQLLNIALERAIVRPRATVIPVSTLRTPIPMLDDESHSTSVFGGVVAHWTEEGASLTASEASFGRTVLDAKKLTAFSNAPNELVADSPAFNAFIDAVWPNAVRFFEDDAFITGSGVGEPLGYLNGTGAIEVAKEAAQAADTIVFANVINMFSRMLPDSLQRAVWLAPPDALPQLLQLFHEPVAGQPVSPSLWLNNGSAVGAPPMTLLGRPVIFTEKAPKLGDAADLSFVDLAYYLIGDRQAMTVQASEHFRFQNDETSYRIIQRVDGRPWVASALTPKNGGATLSPYVKLAERA